jgi:glyoxylase-like metal-dependent hydrolase (beta-lactamase superfamily II)
MGQGFSRNREGGDKEDQIVKVPEILISGKMNGEGTVLRYRTAKGTPIYCLAMPNICSDTDWDLGPTWCYLIEGAVTTLIDTGRFGNHTVLESLLGSISKGFPDIDRVIITHGHEDHDGNLTEVCRSTQGELWAHPIYQQMIAYHPAVDDGATHPELPGGCRSCVMSERFYRTCIPYLERRSTLRVHRTVRCEGDKAGGLDNPFRFLFTPGHTPDSICIGFEDEVIFTGDTVLPGITPHPTLSSTFEVNRRILPDLYSTENTVYGLLNYCRSLQKLAAFRPEPTGIFPGHRLFYNGSFNLLHNLADRCREIVRFHLDRCQDILQIIGVRPTGLDTIVSQHFSQRSLSGAGILVARNEIMAHLEVMEGCGDIRWADDMKEAATSTGSHNYREVMEAYLQPLSGSSGC